MKHLLLLALTISLTACSEYRQNGDAMAPTIMHGDLVDMDETPYKNSSPERWDIVVYESPTDEGDWIARVVGLPGESIDIADGAVVVNGVAQRPQDTTLRYVKDPTGKVQMPYVVPKDSYLLFGDNFVAIDGREFGATPSAKIKGKVTGLNTNPIQKKILEESGR